MTRKTRACPPAWLFFALMLGAWSAGAAAGSSTPAVIVVNSLADPPTDSDISWTDTTVTFREAILLASMDGVPDKIIFDPSLVGGIVRIRRPLPVLTEGLTEIDGDPNPDAAQPGPDWIRIVFDTDDPGPVILKVISGGNDIHHLVFGGKSKTALILAGTQAAANTVKDCHFGYDPTGELPPSDMVLSYGVYLTGGAALNLVGHLLPDGGNVIANCRYAGVCVADAGSSRNRIIGNFIGSPSGSVDGNANGVWVRGRNNIVGGDLDSEANTITGNVFNGVLVEGPSAGGNTVSRNAIYANGRLGIDLSLIAGSGDGPNLYPAARRGPNDWLPAPSVQRYTHELVPIGRHRFTLSGSVARAMAVEVYEADPDPTGYGEGRRFVATGMSDNAGSFSVSCMLNPGTAVTLLGRDAFGNTSEFSQTVILSEMPGDAIIQMQTWQNVFMLPRGFTRAMGLSTNQRSDAPLTVTTSITPTGIASPPATLTLPTDQNHLVFPVSGVAPGVAWFQMGLPSAAGGASCSTLIFVDDAVGATYAPVTERDDVLNGPAPVRFYEISGTAGDILNVYVAALPGSPVDPVIFLFGRWPRNLSVKSNFRGTDCFLQFPLPEDGRYFIGVTDLYLRSGADCAYHVTISKDPANVRDSSPQFVEQTPVPTSSRPKRMAFGDLTNDGWDDMAVAVPGSQKLSILRKRPGAGTGFGNPIDLPLGFTPGALGIADFDRNGWKDILVSHANTGQVTVLYNSGQLAKAVTGKAPATGMPVRTFFAGGGGSMGEASDFNLDSYADYALLDTVNKLLYIFVNDQSGNLEQIQALPAGSQPVALAVGDFNGDAVPDLAVADGAQSQVYVLRGQGTGQFALANTLTTVSQPADLEVTDLDDDGLADVLVCGGGANLLRTHKALQNFDFEVYQDLATGTGPNSIAVADLNADGLEDVSVSNSGSEDIFIYMGLRLGLLQPIAEMSSTGQIEELFWYSFGGGGSYILIPPDENFVRILEGTYRVLDFPDTESSESLAAAFALANPSEEDALVYLSLYNSDGTLINDPDMENPVAVTIPAHQQIAFFVTDAFGQGVGGYESWMRAASLSPDLQGFALLVAGGGELSMDGAVAFTGASPRQVLPAAGLQEVGTDAVCAIVNPGNGAATVTVTCRGTAGQFLADPIQVGLAAGGRASFAFHEAFPQVTGSCYLDIQADQPVESFQYTAGERMMAAANGLAVEETAEGASLLHAAHFAEGRLYRSVLSIINAFPGEAHVTVRAFADDGSPLAESAPIVLPAGGMVEGDLGTLVGIDWQSADFITGYLRVESDCLMLSGSLTFSDRQNGRFSSSLPLQEGGGKSLAFSHLAVGSVGGVDYFTGLTVLNTGTADVHLDIEIRDENGAQTGLGQLTLPPGHKVSQMLQDFVPGFPGQVKGYITLTALEADASLLAFELFGDAALDFLAAVPAQPLN